MGLFEKPILTWMEPGEFVDLQGKATQQLIRKVVPIVWAIFFLVVGGCKVLSTLPNLPLYFGIILIIAFLIVAIGGPFTIFYLARTTKAQMSPDRPVKVYRDCITRKYGKGGQYVDFGAISAYSVKSELLFERRLNVIDLQFHDAGQKEWWSGIKKLAIEDSEKLAHLLTIFRDHDIPDQSSPSVTLSKTHSCENHSSF